MSLSVRVTWSMACREKSFCFKGFYVCVSLLYFYVVGKHDLTNNELMISSADMFIGSMN